MNIKTMRILHVEDHDEEVLSVNTAVKLYNRNNTQLQIEVISAQSLDEAKLKINEPWDGAIIDLKLNNIDNAGELYIEFLKENFVRIPCVILTGTPDNITHHGNLIKIFNKGDAEGGYENIFSYFEQIYNTGLTRIMSTRGKIQSSLYQVFSEAIMPHEKSWIKNSKDHNDTETSLLRYTINHLYSILEDNKTELLPEEFYLKTFVTNNKIKTGSIFKNDNINYIVITPACDLAQGKTQHIQVIEIETHDDVHEKEVKNKSNAINVRDNLRKNNKGNCYHYLPQTDMFCGGFINFRKIKFLDFDSNNHPIASDVQVSPYFMKDIISRFSSYYARQGQPTLKHVPDAEN